MTSTVSDVMTRDVVTVGPDASFREVVQLIEDRHVDGLPVVDEAGTVVGIVTEGDLLLKEEMADGPVGLPWTRRRDRARARATTVREVMTQKVVTVTPDTTLSTAARHMHRHHIGGLPVVDERRRLQGIVTRSDLLKVFLRGDDELRSDVAAAIGPAAEQAITCSVTEGKVVLEGHVYLRSDALRIEAAARRVPGVIDVQDQIGFDVDDLAAAMAGA